MTSAALMIVLIAGGGVVLAVAILAAFYLLSTRRRLSGSAENLRGSDPELARALAEIQADIEKGQRGF